MTRKTVVELLAQNTASFPDNTTGQITPALLRTMFQDFLDSFAPAYGAFNRTSLVTLPTVGTTPVVVPWQAITVSQGPEFTAGTPALGTITRNDTQASTSFNCQMSFSAPNNSVSTVTVFVNGQPTVYSATFTSTGTGNLHEINIVGLSYNATAAVFEVRINTDAGTDSIDIVKGSFFCSAVPVRTAV